MVKKKCDNDIYTIFWKSHDISITIYRQTIFSGLFVTTLANCIPSSSGFILPWLHTFWGDSPTSSHPPLCSRRSPSLEICETFQQPSLSFSAMPTQSSLPVSVLISLRRSLPSCSCLNPAPLPAGDSQKFLEGVLIVGHPNPALDGANRPTKKTNKWPQQGTILFDKFTHLSAASLL